MPEEKLLTHGRRLLPLVAVAFFIAALVALRHELHAHRYSEIVAHLRALPGRALWLSGGLAGLGYVVLTRYDALALRYAGRSIPEAKIIVSSFISYALSQTLGWAIFTGGALRYRFWSTWGLSGAEIAQAVTFVGATFWLGVLTMSGVALVLEPGLLARATSIPAVPLRLLGVLFLGLATAYVVLCAARRVPVVVRGVSLVPPSAGQALVQLVVSSMDWTLAAGALAVLLPARQPIPFPSFVGVFVVAQVAGLISHLPGGLGVFDTIMILALKPFFDPGAVMGALVAYRAIYYLAPFLLALVVLTLHEVARQRRSLTRLTRFAGRWAPGLAPLSLSLLVLFGGVVLLVSGATPAVPSRLHWLAQLLPLGMIEVSHFVASLAGTGLVLLAWGLRRRLDAAYYLTLAGLAVGALASLGKGADYEEALLLSAIIAALLPAHRLFHRKAALLAEPLSRGWIAAVVIVLASVLVLGEFSYQHVAYRDELWWQFTLRGDAPRFLRGMVGSLGLLAVVGIARLLRPSRPEPSLPDEVALQRACAIHRDSTQPASGLALLGDKGLLFSESGKGFLMYAVSGRSWVAMGDPVGPKGEQEELVWTFRSLVHQHDAWPVFYEVGREHLPLYIDLGLTLSKLGEEARLSLTDFSLDGSNRRGLRRVQRQMEREGCCFEVVEREQVPALLPALRAVSDQWLAGKHAREKSFSLGFFDPAYLSWFRHALVRRQGEIIAFANLWEAAPGTEISMDLMRYASAAPNGVMDFLFLNSFRWAQQQGYRWFRLGMAPLSGFEQHSLAPLWHRVGSLVYQHGEHFYHFRGLRQYKEKFDPVWEPRYLASPGGLALPRVLANVTTLISDGWRGLIRT